MSSILVGVDDSANSTAALRWAGAEASLRGCTLRAVHAWRYTDTAPRLHADAAVAPIVEPQGRAIAILDIMIADAALPADVVIERVVCEGSPAKVLLNESKGDIELLVVGARGRGGMPGLSLGSVAAHLLNHADLPVVVVRAPDGPATRTRT